ncbi:MAG TPA: STAS domain-containing protein [Spirochaetota bacterium]|nr:STAS domain-containing protein [Spirochaetota bacterium]
MFIQHTVKDSVAIVTVEGYIDHTNAVQFEEYIATLQKEFNAIIIDCSKLNYISSTGFGALMYAQRVVESGGGVVVLCHCNKEIVTLIDIIALPVKRYNSLDEAMEAVQDTEVKIIEKPVPPKESPKKETYTETKPVARTSMVFEHPLVIECPDCRTMVRISSPGKFKCPDCGLQFTVDDDQTVYFN